MSKLKQVLKQVQCISFNGGWTHIKAEGIDELVSILTEGFDTADTSKLKAKQMELYTTCYKMCKWVSWITIFFITMYVYSRARVCILANVTLIIFQMSCTLNTEKN